MKNKSKYIIIALISIFLLGASFAVIEFESIKLRKNPAIILPEGQTIVNDAEGTVKFPGAKIVASHFITEDTSVSSRTYFVAPDFSNDTIKHTAGSISFALSKIQSGTVFVYDGIYVENITAKSNVSIMGTGAGKVVIASPNGSTVTIDGVANFFLKDLTISNNDTNSSRYCINISNCGPGSTQSPVIKFENIEVIRDVKSELPVSAIYCNASSFAMTGSYVQATGLSAGATGLVRLVFITNASFPIFNGCKFKANLFSGDISLCYGDESSAVLAGNCQNETNTTGRFISFITEDGTQINGTAYNNVSNVVISGDFINVFSVQNNNLTAANFIVR